MMIIYLVFEDVSTLKANHLPHLVRRIVLLEFCGASDVAERSFPTSFACPERQGMDVPSFSDF